MIGAAGSLSLRTGLNNGGMIVPSLSEHKMNKWIALPRDLIELYIPALSFVLMFVTFIWQIFCRYVLRAPAPWAYEVTVACYLWMVILGACYAQRERSHVTFTLVYDKLQPRGKALVSFLGNLLIFIAFTYAFVPSAQFILFMKMQKTSVLKIGLDIIYLPYIPFMVIIMLYALQDLYRDFRVFSGLASSEEVQAMLMQNRSEVEEAIEGAQKEEAEGASGQETRKEGEE